MFRLSNNARLTGIFCALSAGFAQTPTPATTAPGTAYLQNATIVGSTNSLSITRLPVTAGGKTYYWDILLPFDVDTAGNVSTGMLTAEHSPNLISSAFESGTYHTPSTVFSGKGLITVTGPGVWNGVYTEWTIGAASGANGCTYPATAVFYVSSLSGNPIYARLKKAGISSTAWSYGVGTSSCYNTWPGNGIIGVSQVGKTLTIASFSYGSTDYSTPVDTITYSLP